MTHRPVFGIDGRWLTNGPPSGVNYVRRTVRELAASPNASQYVVFGRSGAAAHIGSNRGMTVRIVPSVPSLLFNAAMIPMASPREIRAVLYQNFTPLHARPAAVTVIHDMIFMTSPDQFTPAERAYLSLIPRLLPRAKIVVAVSEHVRGQVLERWPDRDPATVVTAPNGISQDLIDAAARGASPGDVPTRERLGIRAPYLLYLGRLNRRKNLARLIRAFARSGLGDHHLVLAGANSGASDDLARIAREAGVGHRVDLVGRVPDDDLPAIFRGASVFAYVSLDEGFGVPPLEAMAFGLPVVCSDIPALRETSERGGAQFVAPGDEAAIGEALYRAATDPALLERARLLGPEHASRYRWSRTAQILHETLELAGP